MQRKYSRKEIQDLAAGYALGILKEKDRRHFEKILREDRDFPKREFGRFLQVVNQLGFATPIANPPRRLKGQLIKRVAEAKKLTEDLTQDGRFLFVRSGEGEWQEVIKGVKVKNLFTDAKRRYSTVLVKMGAGATFPDHRHAETEECFIISGDLHMGGKVFYAGDYIRADADTVHESIYSKSGCTLLVAASQENEMLS